MSKQFQKNSKQEFSVVIVNHNAGDWLLRSVSAALKQVHQVIVVDNASYDNSLALVEAQFLKDERVIILRAGNNQGFSVGCNQGAQAAKGEYILFLNPDCILQDHAVVRLVDVMQKNTAVGMAGGLLVDEQGKEQRGGRRVIPTLQHALLNFFGLSRFWGDFNLHKQPLPNEPIEIEAISGAMMFVRRDAFLEVGCFDERYFLHCEDLDLCMRFSQARWKIVFVPNAVAMHCQGVCSKARPIFVSWHKHKGMIRFYRKFFRSHNSRWLSWFVVSGIGVSFGMVAIRHFLLHKFSKIKPC